MSGAWFFIFHCNWRRGYKSGSSMELVNTETFHFREQCGQSRLS